MGGYGNPGLKDPGLFRRAVVSSWQAAWGEQALFPPLQTIPEGGLGLKYRLLFGAWPPPPPEAVALAGCLPLSLKAGGC